MAYIKSYKELIVWQKSVQLVKEVFVLTEKFPKTEIFGITSQMRRSSVSIPSNIAEGYGRRSTRDYIRFYSISYGSALELETQLIISKELKLADSKLFQKCEQLLEEVCKMLNSMSNKIKLNASA